MSDKIFQFPQIYTLEASAGSGKTYALAKRYLQLLLASPNGAANEQNPPLNAILAITFTNKAAMEMKARILELLKKVALNKFSGPKEADAIYSCLRMDEEAAAKKSYQAIAYLMRNYNFFQVQTIDSFINAIICGCAFKLNLSANFTTEENYTDYLAYSLDNLIDKANHDQDVLAIFKDFLQHYIYIENKSSWFPKQDILAIMASLFSRLNRQRGDFIHDLIQAKDLLRHKNGILALMRKLSDILPEKTNKSFGNSLDKFLQNNINTFDLEDLSDFFKREEFPLNKAAVAPSQVKEVWQKIRFDIARLCELEAASLFNNYIDIFNSLLLNLRDVCAKDDIIFLEALNKQAQSLFSENQLMLPELYYRLACRFKHFLIDEFQDTSILQWDNLFIMIEEALSVDGSLFCVGDKKQAIYRFRGGESGLINSVKGLFKGPVLIEEFLETNYRSQKEIVKFNNFIFSHENLGRFIGQIRDFKKDSIELSLEEIQEIMQVFSGKPQRYLEDKDGGYVNFKAIDCPTKQARDGILKKELFLLIDDLKERFNYEDIAILARKNDEVELLTSWLLEKGIPVESEKTLNIKENSYIKELVSFLKFLDSPIDNLAFASFVTGEIFSIASGIEPKKIRDFIFQAKTKNASQDQVYLYKEFRLEFAQAWEDLIEEFFKSAGFVPLYELVVSIFGSFKVITTFAQQQGFFMRFLELVKEQEEKAAGLSSFLDFYDQAHDSKLYVNIAESRAVKVLTIHKAKGLEFPVVVVPFLEMALKMGVIDVSLVDGGQLRLLRVKRKYADFSASLSRIYKREYLMNFVDELNSIYVALTRAREELYIFSALKAELGFNLANLLFPEQCLEQGVKIQRKYARNKTSAPIVKISHSEYKQWWRHLLNDEYQSGHALQVRLQALKGEYAHSILAFIGNLDGQDKDLALAMAIEKARVAIADRDVFDSAVVLVRKLINNLEFSEYFSCQGGDIFTEKEIVNRSGDSKRIDRLILFSKEAVVVDYKSKVVESENSAHQKQVQGYLQIVRDIYPDKRVRGVLIYLDDLSVEEIA